jgi:hypothetical protein
LALGPCSSVANGGANDALGAHAPLSTQEITPSDDSV